MTDPITIDNISSFFELSQYEYSVFDMSRTVRRLSNNDFKKIETQQILFPTPFQQQAWLGIMFWHSDSVNEPAIWFLRFPIDELGFLKLEARDHFIQEMLEQVGRKVVLTEGDATNEAQGAKKGTKAEHQSAFAFKPQQDKMAIFNALATRELAQNPSKDYAHAQDYLAGRPGYDQWAFLGFQGLADVVANLDIHGNAQKATQAIPLMPEQPLMLFSQLLEHVQPDASLSQALLDRLTVAMQQPSPNVSLITSLARGLSASECSDKSTRFLLDSPLKTNIEILALIASRAWWALKNCSLLKDYLESLAQLEQQSFDVILMELLPIPDMREVLVAGLRSTNRSSELTARIDGFMQRFQSN